MTFRPGRCEESLNTILSNRLRRGRVGTKGKRGKREETSREAAAGSVWGSAPTPVARYSGNGIREGMYLFLAQPAFGKHLFYGGEEGKIGMGKKTARSIAVHEGRIGVQFDIGDFMGD